MLKLLSLTVAAMLALTAAAHAQQRTAGQAYDAQVNWASLKGSIDMLNTQNLAISATVTAISAKLDAIAACGAQRKAWTGSGCVDAGGGKQKIETKAFSLKYDQCHGFARIPGTNPINKQFCQAHGYDDALSGGSEGMQCSAGHGERDTNNSVVTYYGTCMRSVAE